MLNIECRMSNVKVKARVLGFHFDIHHSKFDIRYFVNGLIRLFPVPLIL